ncbi:MAG: ABC transporter ATP-binding protein [Acutalibacteraceae bacterium]
MLCAFIVALCDLFYPVIAKDIINEYVPSQNLRLLLVWAGVLLGIYALKALLNYIIQYWGHVVGVRMRGICGGICSAGCKLPFSFYDENKTGAVMSRLINDLFDVSELAHHGPEDLFLSAIMLVGSFVMLATIDVWLTLIVFAFLPFIVLFAVKTRKEMNRAFKKAREEIAEINAGLETSISGVRVTRAYTAEDYENAGFDRANERFKHARGDAYRIMGVFHSHELLYGPALPGGAGRGRFVFLLRPDRRGRVYRVPAVHQYVPQAGQPHRGHFRAASERYDGVRAVSGDYGCSCRDRRTRRARAGTAGGRHPLRGRALRL